MESSGNTDPNIPLHNLSKIHLRIDSVQRFLCDSIERNVRITDHQMEAVSSEITTAIRQIIADGAALIACAQNPKRPDLTGRADPDYNIVELDAVELLAEHVHFCEICGKGFKRDANLRMHMRAHGNRFKTADALAKPVGEERSERTRFSCPYEGCKRNRKHGKFRALKSVICVKNHFKRSHCPKMYSCDRCKKKSFSVVSDLKSHLKHCGQSRWRCTCGTSFSRKDKLFGHVALFEGHMPAAAAVEMEEDEDLKGVVDFGGGSDGSGQGYFDSFIDGFGSVENQCLQEVLGFSNDLGLDSDSDWKFCGF